MKLKIKKMYPDVVLPEYESSGAACFDIRAYAPYAAAVMEGADSYTVGTGLKFEVPEGYVLQVFSRSGHGFNEDVRLSNGTGIIDSDYRGELKIKLYKDFSELNQSPFVVMHGDRIAQAMLVKLPKVEIVEVDALTDTERGEAGFGSTGVK